MADNMTPGCRLATYSTEFLLVLTTNIYGKQSHQHFTDKAQQS